jgi:hypothetical protein
MDNVFNPGVSTLERLVELTHEVDFAAFVFAQDDWTTRGASTDEPSGHSSPRDNVVFEAGLFGGALGIRRTFILHADGAKLPTDLLGLTSIEYEPDTTPAIVRQINQKLRKAIETEGRLSRLEGDWWQLSLTARTELEPFRGLAPDDQPGPRRCTRAETGAKQPAVERAFPGVPRAP